MKKYNYICLVILWIVSVPLFSEIKRLKYNDGLCTIKKYEILDIAFNVNKLDQEPFELDVKAIFKSPSGEEKLINLFYNGDTEYILRFSGYEPGEWTYRIMSSDQSLNSKKGIINVSDIPYSNRKGAIQLNDKYPHSFFWENKDPYFAMAFECDFIYALDYLKPQTKRLSHFLDGIADNGFNQIVMNVYAHDVVWEKDSLLKEYPQYEFGADSTIYPFLGHNGDPDHSALNTNFFKHFDKVVEEMNDRNMVAHLMIYVWNKAVNWPEIASDEDNRYFDYIIKRYQAFTNVVWDISKEALFYGVVGDEYIKERIGRVKKLDSYGRLVTVHDFGFCNRNKELVDFISCQDWSLQIYNSMLNAYKKFAGKPVFNIEHGGYEESSFKVFTGSYTNAEYCLRRNYECAFAGVYSTYYWQATSWNVIIYDWDVQSDLYKPRFDYFKHFADFFTEYPFYKFSPYPSFNSSGYCLKGQDDTYLIYVPKESLKVALNKLQKESKALSYQWFNTHTGEYSDVEKSNEMNIFAIPQSPWYMHHDAILIVKVLEQK